jgi:hypothetical protein
MLYKYCNVSGFDIILRSRIRAARFENFNDPFELVFRTVDEEEARQDIWEEYRKNPGIIREWKELFGIKQQGLSDDLIVKEVAARQLANLNNSVRQIKDQWNKTMGVICLSEKPDIIQMWAHYCGNHVGIVIGIDENEFVQEPEGLIKVAYQDNMVCLHVKTIKDDQYYSECIQDVIRRKETHWKYEEEVRAYFRLDEKDADGNYYVKLLPSSVKEIYLGLRAHETARIIAEAIKQRREYQHVKLYQMRKHDRTYKLTPEEIMTPNESMHRITEKSGSR